MVYIAKTPLPREEGITKSGNQSHFAHNPHHTIEGGTGPGRKTLHPLVPGVERKKEEG